MKQIMKQNKFKSKEKITKVEVTGDTLTGRGGLALFVRYLSSINIYVIRTGSDLFIAFLIHPFDFRLLLPFSRSR